MPVRELYRSERGSTLDREIGYVVSDTANSDSAIAEIKAAAPALFGTGPDPLGNFLEFADVEVDETDGRSPGAAINTYEGRALYRYRYQCPKISYDFATETGKRTRAFEEISAQLPTANTDDAKDNELVMGLTSEGEVQGADVLLPTGTAVMLWHPPPQGNVWDVDYFVKINGMIGKINETPFYGWNQSEMLMEAAQANFLENDQRWELEFRFRVGKTQNFGTNEFVPGFPAVVIPPFSHVEIEREQTKQTRATGADYSAPRILQVTVLRKYEKSEFAEIFEDSNGNYVIASCPDAPPDPNP